LAPITTIPLIDEPAMWPPSGDQLGSETPAASLYLSVPVGVIE
jgi:hypothetical protein